MPDRIIDGTSGDDTLRGIEAGDQIFGLGGRDRLFGNRGDDLLEGGRGNDLIDGGAGSDTVSFADATRNGQFVDLSGTWGDGSGGRDTLANVENILGTRSADQINVSGPRGANEAYGMGGDDILQAGDGPDRLFGGLGNDELRGGLGNQFLDGGSGRDDIGFGSSDGVGHGGRGADTFSGKFGAQSSNSIDDFLYGTDRLDLGFEAEETADVLDSNGNGRLDRGDDAVSVRRGDLTIDLTALYAGGSTVALTNSRSRTTRASGSRTCSPSFNIPAARR